MPRPMPEAKAAWPSQLPEPTKSALRRLYNRALELAIEEAGTPLVCGIEEEDRKPEAREAQSVLQLKPNASAVDNSEAFTERSSTNGQQNSGRRDTPSHQ